MRGAFILSIVFCLFFALGTSACTQQQTETASFSAEDAAAVRANLETLMKADPIDEPETFFSQVTEDVYWASHNMNPWKGIEELKSVEWCHTLSASEITADRVEVSIDLAYARGTYRLSLDCGQEAPVDSEGVFLSVHRRQQDGSWRIEALLQKQ